jgi:GT2 family glycosyltransferase
VSRVEESGALSRAGARSAVSEASRTVAVVLHYRREAMTAQCIASLEASTRPPRVLVVDNASGDGSYERLQMRFPHCEFLQTGGNFGYAGGNNRGINWALEQGATRVLVINDDATVEPDAVAMLEDALANNRSAAIAAPTIVFGTRPDLAWWAGGTFLPMKMLGRHDGYAQPLHNASETREVTFISGCCLLIDAAALRALGAFDASYHAYVEDVELCVRYAKAGKRLLWVPAATAAHHLPYPEPEPTPAKIIARDRNRRRLAMQHFGLLARSRFYAWFAASRAVSALRYAVTGDFPRAAAILRGWFSRL